MNDVTIISNVMISDGIGKHGLIFLKSLKDNYKCSYKIIGTPIYKDISAELMATLIKPFSGYGKFGLWTYILGLTNSLLPLHEEVNKNCQIKIAYSMFESDKIPDFWVNILNKYYDFVIVPDQWLVSVYQKCGVTIPIFVIPLAILLEQFLQQIPKKEANKIFTFGMTGSFIERKNHLKLINAFAKEFGNNENFKLRIHGRFGPIKNKIEEEVKKLNLSNLELCLTPLSQEKYLNFMQSLDCYVFPSMGEGFSITPRESLSLGIPTIISNNTAHKTICETGLVIPVDSKIKKPAVFEYFQNKQIGNTFDCTEEDLIEKMKYVVDNYSTCLELLKPARVWVQQYLESSLQPTYLNIFKANGLKLGEINEISPSKWETNSKILFEKMKNI